MQHVSQAQCCKASFHMCLLSQRQQQAAVYTLVLFITPPCLSAFEHRVQVTTVTGLRGGGARSASFSDGEVAAGCIPPQSSNTPPRALNLGDVCKEQGS